MAKTFSLTAVGLKYGLAAFLLFLLIFSHRLETSSSFLGLVLREFDAVFQDPATQWMVFLCVVINFATFLCLGPPVLDDFWQLSHPNVWLVCALSNGVFSYALKYSAALQPLIFLAGALVGRGTALWAGFQNRKAGAENRIRTESIFSLLIVILLALAALYRSSIGPIYNYRLHGRWSGPWESPNIAGIFMGLGIVLAVGQILGLRRLKTQKLKWEEMLFVFLCFCAVIGMGWALLHSYSRGAWIATICGVAYLIWKSECRMQNAENKTRNTEFEMGNAQSSSRVYFSWFRKNWAASSIVLLSVVVLTFWHFRHCKHDVFADRVFSIGNVNDFSWRNRISAWEGTWQIIAEHPWFGAGWSEPEPLYGHYYLPPKLDESGAIVMNDYLTLGATLGIPALIFFGMYVWLSLTQKSEVRSRKSEVGEAESEDQKSEVELYWLRTTCRAGAIVLAVGFWFDGGLFKLATASVFWILLELGRENLPISKETRISRTGTN